VGDSRVILRITVAEGKYRRFLKLIDVARGREIQCLEGGFPGNGGGRYFTAPSLNKKSKIKQDTDGMFKQPRPVAIMCMWRNGTFDIRDQ